MSTDDAEMRDAVDVRGLDEPFSEVVIRIVRQDGETPTVDKLLARAWALLAEAITENKQAAPDDHGAERQEPDADEAEQEPPGSGAWWNG
jgi:hypothetical protein